MLKNEASLIRSDIGVFQQILVVDIAHPSRIYTHYGTLRVWGILPWAAKPHQGD